MSLSEAAALAQDGFALLEGFLSAEELASVDAQWAGASMADGDRRMLDREWCRVLAHVCRLRLLKRRLLPRASRPVLCRAFHNPAGSGCGMAPHRDVFVPLAARFERPGWRGWNLRQGIAQVQPPEYLLEQMLMLRLFVDPCGPGDAPLLLRPGSHRLPAETREARACTAAAGAALVMRPMLEHAVDNPATARPRRVLGFLFGPTVLPEGARWFYEI